MIKKITFDTYPLTLFIIIAESDENVVDFVEKELIPELLEDLLSFSEDDEALFVYKSTNPTNIAIRLRDTLRPEIIAHEALHATAYILRYVGIRFTKTSEEAYAYLLQYIIENIHD